MGNFCAEIAAAADYVQHAGGQDISEDLAHLQWVYGLGLSTIVLPASSAGDFPRRQHQRKFHGVMVATTLSGRRTASAKARMSSWMTSRGSPRFA
jgi:hypothetical protein